MDGVCVPVGLEESDAVAETDAEEDCERRLEWLGLDVDVLAAEGVAMGLSLGELLPDSLELLLALTSGDIVELFEGLPLIELLDELLRDFLELLLALTDGDELELSDGLLLLNPDADTSGEAEYLLVAENEVDALMDS